MSSRRPLLLVLFFPLLMAANCRDRTKDTENLGIDPNPPSVKLQVSNIDPDSGIADQSFRVRILGSNFQDGAQVTLNDRAVTTTFRSENVLNINVPPMAAGSYDVRVTNRDGEVATLRSALQIKANTTPTPNSQCEDIKVYFELDSSRLEPASQAILNDVRGCLPSPNATVRVEGHCDERGTIDYNIALGQRRAESVRRYLITQGIPPANIKTISYGEERPLVDAHNEAAWKQNRRAEIRF